MTVNLEYYRTFYKVATLGSMGKAAEEMCLTPPTITKTIQALELQLNCQLFTRSVKGVQLTAAGEALLACVEPGLLMLDSGEREINMINSLDGGTVRIGMSEASACYFTMPAVFGTFCNRYPKVKLEIKHLSTIAAFEAIQSGAIDFAILGISDCSICNSMNTRILYRSDNVAVVGKQLYQLTKNPIHLNDLSKYPLIFVQSGYSIRQHYENLYKLHGLKFMPNIETPTLDMQIKAVKLGLGYSFVPYPYIKEDLENGTLFMLDIMNEDTFVRCVCLITTDEAPLSIAAQALVDVLLFSADKFNSPIPPCMSTIEKKSKNPST